MTTLKDYIDEYGKGIVLDGLTFAIPRRIVVAHHLPKDKLTLRSAWRMGDGKVGLWFQLPDAYPSGQSWPVFDIDFEGDMMTWKVEA